ncbi:MAG: protoporphyrinogen oxidase, partial [Blastocatellia bacterium]|nr:protoporphyrinogen oxidase [Blastocatellia bacterium]
MKYDSIIIGAGISGLVAAHRLKKSGCNILLVESTERAGGVIESANAEGFLIEKGPNSLRGTHEFLDLVEELDLTSELVTGDPRAPAYVYAGGVLHRVPLSPPALIKTRLISNSAKLRLLCEPFISKRSADGEESIASFVRRRLGKEILEKLVAPFLSGVYAGDPAQLSVQACFPRLAGFEAEKGSILRGALQAARTARPSRKETPKRSLRPYRLCSFRQGLQVLPRALAQALGESLLTGARVSGISKISGRTPGFIITLEQHGEESTYETAALLIATPSPAAGQLLAECAPEISGLLAQIPYASLVSVPLAYPAENVSRELDGFGFLAPRGEGLRTLGSIWNSSLFAERAPDEWILTTNFIGGATDPRAVELSDEELIKIVD